MLLLKVYGQAPDNRPTFTKFVDFSVRSILKDYLQIAASLGKSNFLSAPWLCKKSTCTRIGHELSAISGLNCAKIALVHKISVIFSVQLKKMNRISWKTGFNSSQTLYKSKFCTDSARKSKLLRTTQNFVQIWPADLVRRLDLPIGTNREE